MGMFLDALPCRVSGTVHENPWKAFIVVVPGTAGMVRLPHRTHSQVHCSSLPEWAPDTWQESHSTIDVLGQYGLPHIVSPYDT